MCTHLSTLQISPHGTFSADGHTSAIENAQHKHWECEQHHEYNAQHYCCHWQPEAQNTPLHWHTAAGHTSHQQEETLTPHLTWTSPHSHSDPDPNIWHRKYTGIFKRFVQIFQQSVQQFSALITNISWGANQHIIIISEKSCDTDDWSNDAENTALHSQE